MTGRVNFTELVDFAEGRSAPDRAALIERSVAADIELATSLDWIRSFLADAATMRLQRPPAELSARLRALFGEAGHGGDADGWARATLMHDSRRMAAAGVRTSATTDSAYLAYESPVGRFVVEIGRAGVDTVDLQGLVLASAPDDGVDLTFLQQGVLRRAARTGRDGRFEVRSVPVGVDELRISSGADRVSVRLDLTLG